MNKRFLLSVLALLGAGTPLAAQWGSTGQMRSADPAKGDLLGSAVALDGDWLALGAPRAATIADEAGAVEVHRWDAGQRVWTAHSILHAGNAAAGDHFGSAVAVLGGTLLVGAPDQSGGGSGAAYVFVYDDLSDQWTEQGRLTAADRDFTGERFGAAVALAEDMALIGAPDDSDQGADAGAAYVFRRDPVAQTWAEEQKLHPDVPAAGDRFGHAVDLTTGAIVVAAPYATPFSQSGAVSVFRWDSVGSFWYPEYLLTPPLAADDDLYGWSVAVLESSAVSGSAPRHVGGDRICIGAPWFEGGATDSGAVFLYRYFDETTNWVLEAQVEPRAPLVGGRFGESVALDGDRVFVGEIDGAALGEGALNVMRLDQQTGQWDQEGLQLLNTDQEVTEFGVAVSAQGGRVAAGGYHEDGQGLGVGAVESWKLTRVTLWPDEPSALGTLLVTLENGVPLTDAYLVSGSDTTGTAVPSLGVSLIVGGTVELQATGVTDADGVEAWAFTLPPQTAGRSVWLQCAQPGVTSEAIWLEVQP